MIAETESRPLRVLALTRSKPWQPPTLALRVEMLVPHLRDSHGIHVDVERLPHGRAAKRAFAAEHSGYDIVWLHRYATWPWELARLKKLGRHVVLDIDDPIGYSSSNYANFSFSRWLKFRATARGCSAVLAASDGLHELAATHNANTHLVRLCADPDSHLMQARRRVAGEPLRLLWLGSKSTFKYLESIRDQLEAIGRLGRNVELVVIGHHQLELKHLQVTNVAWSREAELEQFVRCHVGLVPLIEDRWTRAKATLKPLQYLSNGMPFVASPVGVNLRISDQSRNGLLARSPDEWAAAVARFDDDENMRYTMGLAGIEYVRAHHSPEVLADLVADIFHTLARDGVVSPRSDATDRNTGRRAA